LFLLITKPLKMWFVNRRSGVGVRSTPRPPLKHFNLSFGTTSPTSVMWIFDIEISRNQACIRQGWMRPRRISTFFPSPIPLAPMMWSCDFTQYGHSTATNFQNSDAALQHHEIVDHCYSHNSPASWIAALHHTVARLRVEAESPARPIVKWVLSAAGRKAQIDEKPFLPRVIATVVASAFSRLPRDAWYGLTTRPVPNTCLGINGLHGTRPQHRPPTAVIGRTGLFLPDRASLDQHRQPPGFRADESIKRLNAAAAWNKARPIRRLQPIPDGPQLALPGWAWPQ